MPNRHGNQSLMILEGRFHWQKLAVVSILQGVNQKLISVGRKKLIKFSELKKILKPVGVPPFAKHLEVCIFWIVEKLLQQNEYTVVHFCKWKCKLGKKCFAGESQGKIPIVNFSYWKNFSCWRCYRSTPVENLREKLIFVCFRFAIENVCTLNMGSCALMFFNVIFVTTTRMMAKISK